MNTNRRKSPQAPLCETLEGRQLMASDFGMGMGMPPMAPGGTADVSMTGSGNVTVGRWGGMDGGDHAPADFMRGDFGGRGGPGGVSGDPGSVEPTTVTASDPSTTAASTTWSDQASPLKDALEKLRSDQQAIHDKSEVTPVMEAKVRKGLEAVQQAATGTADETALATLQKDTDAAYSGTDGPTDDQLAQIRADQDAVYKSQGVSDDLLTQLHADEDAVKAASHVTADDLATLAADRKAIDAASAATTQGDAGQATDVPTLTQAPGWSQGGFQGATDFAMPTDMGGGAGGWNNLAATRGGVAFSAAGHFAMPMMMKGDMTPPGQEGATTLTATSAPADLAASGAIAADATPVTTVAATTLATSAATPITATPVAAAATTAVTTAAPTPVPTAPPATPTMNPFSMTSVSSVKGRVLFNGRHSGPGVHGSAGIVRAGGSARTARRSRG